MRPSRHTWLIAGALTASALLAVYPAPQRGVAGLWWLADMVLLALAVRGRRWAGGFLTYTTVLGALLFLAAGAAQLTTDPRFFERGVALALASLLLINAGRHSRAARAV